MNSAHVQMCCESKCWRVMFSRMLFTAIAIVKVLEKKHNPIWWLLFDNDPLTKTLFFHKDPSPSAPQHQGQTDSKAEAEVFFINPSKKKLIQITQIFNYSHLSHECTKCPCSHWRQLIKSCTFQPNLERKQQLFTLQHVVHWKNTACKLMFIFKTVRK